MKVWTPEELEKAEPAMLQRYYGASAPHDVPANMKPVHKIRNVAIDLQCELNEARELLLAAVDGMNKLVDSDQLARFTPSACLTEWLSRNAPKGRE